eukprot:387712-Pelagomonas_calceolata.AAC.1
MPPGHLKPKMRCKVLLTTTTEECCRWTPSAPAASVLGNSGVLVTMQHACLSACVSAAGCVADIAQEFTAV